MRNFLLILLIAGRGLLPAGVQADPTNDTPAALRAQLDAVVNQARFAQAEWGVKVICLASGAVVYEHNADKLLKPASNAKIYTAALALDELGPGFRIKTSVYAEAKTDVAGVIHGDLLVYGRGDPTFAARFNDGDYARSLQPLAAALAAAGVKKIEGGLIGDESYFHGAPYGTDWTWDDLQTYYGAPVSALAVEDDTIDLTFKPAAETGRPAIIVAKPDGSPVKFINRTRTTAAKTRARVEVYRPVGETNVYVHGDVPLDSKGVQDSVSVPNPALWFVSLLKAELAKEGVTVGGGVQSVNWLDRETAPLDWSKWTEIASVQSRPLSEIVKNTLKPSQNQYAQLLLLQIGANAKTDIGPERNTAAAGMAEMRKFLGEQVGIKPGMALLEEGSGLSRGALVTPSASVQLLSYMAKDRCHAAFYDALPVAGVDGTLRNRFKNTPAAGRLHAKTGSLGHVDTLSGYVTTAGGDPLAFSIMLNNYRGTDGRAQIDSVAVPLAAFAGKLP